MLLKGEDNTDSFQAIPLFNLPIEILIRIYADVDIDMLRLTRQLCKESYALFNPKELSTAHPANDFWRDKFRVHFPDNFEQAKLNPGNWYTRFRSQHMTAYEPVMIAAYNDFWHKKFNTRFPDFEKSTPSLRVELYVRFFSCAKDSYAEGIKKAFEGLTKEELDKIFTLRDKQGLMIIDWAILKGSQPVLDAIYQCMEAANTPIWPSVYTWLVLCNQVNIPLSSLEDKQGDLDAKPIGKMTASMHAARLGQVEPVQSLMLLSNYSNLDEKDDAGRTALIFAVLNGHEAVVKALVRLGGDISNLTQTITHGVITFTPFDNPLTMAARLGFKGILETLFQSPQSIDLAMRERALAIAAATGRVDILQFLLEKGAKITRLKSKLIYNLERPRFAREYTTKDSALSIAADRGHLPALECLFAGEQKITPALLNPALLKVAANGQVGIISFLIAKAREFHDWTDKQATFENALITTIDNKLEEAFIALFNEAKKDHIKFSEVVLKNIIRYGTMPMISCFLADAAPEIRSQALVIAIYRKKSAVVRLLLEELKANANATKMSDEGPLPVLFIAIDRSEDLEIINLLIDNNADVNAVDSELNTPLHAAVFSLAATEILVKAGANIHSQTKLGHTPFSWACERGFLDVAERLLSLGANPDTNTLEGGQTALMSAITKPTMYYKKSPQQNRQSRVDFLIAKSNVNTQDHGGYTALMHAIVKYSEDCLNWSMFDIQPDFISDMSENKKLPLDIFICQLLRTPEIDLGKEVTQNCFVFRKGDTALDVALRLNCFEVARRIYRQERQGIAYSESLSPSDFDKTSRFRIVHYMILDLRKYLKNISALEPKACQKRFFGVKRGPSAGEKTAAALALLDYVLGLTEKETLFAHKRALCTEELAKIFKSFGIKLVKSDCKKGLVI